MEAYSKAGADVLFPEALHSEEEMRKACSTLDKPCMANMSNHGKTPVPPAGVLAEIGYAYAIYPSLTSLAACAAMEKALIDLKQEGIGQPDGLFDFSEFCSLIGFEDVWAFERKWGKAG
jgi:2-methylisocitrate lyase-like PEP mutase family enzyme